MRHRLADIPIEERKVIDTLGLLYPCPRSDLGMRQRPECKLGIIVHVDCRHREERGRECSGVRSTGLGRSSKHRGGRYRRIGHQAWNDRWRGWLDRGVASGTAVTTTVCGTRTVCTTGDTGVGVGCVGVVHAARKPNVIAALVNWNMLSPCSPSRFSFSLHQRKSICFAYGLCDYTAFPEHFHRPRESISGTLSKTDVL